MNRYSTINMANKIKILWLAPHFNHYKARFLDKLHQGNKVELSLLAGNFNTKKGYADFTTSQFSYPIQFVSTTKKWFGMSWTVLLKIFSWNRRENFDWIMVPCEVKNIPLLCIMAFMRIFNQYRIFSYNHASVGPDKKYYFISKMMYALCDRVIFYTEQERNLALQKNLLSNQKAYFANNTLDNNEIRKYYSFEIKSQENPAILFIGRLIPNKRIWLLIQYYKIIKELISNLHLLIIGDGPDMPIVKAAAEVDNRIEYFGALSDEAEISKQMKRSDLVFNAGLSGLSVNHAFMYGKPYLTCANSPHAPEVWYLKDGENGLMLSGTDMKGDCARIVKLLNDRISYKNYCINAFETAQKYSVQAWVEEMSECLKK